MRFHLSTRRIAAVLLSASLVLAACGGDDDDTTSASESTGSERSAELGTPNPATGSPVHVGLVTHGKAATMDTSAEISAANAAVSYVNEYLGGLAGHRVVLDVCEDKNTPAGAQACTDEVIRKGAVAVLQTASNHGQVVLDAASEAKVPHVIFNGDPAMQGTYAHSLGNSLSTAVVGPARIAEQENIKKAGMLLPAVPAAEGLKAFGGLIYGKVDAKFEMALAPMGAPDVTPQIQQLISAGVGQITIVGLEAFCLSGLKAVKTLAYDGLVIIPDACRTDAVLKGVPGGFAGVKVTTPLSLDPSTEDYKIFDAAMDTYQEGADKTGIAPYGFSTVVSFVRALSGLTGEVTAESVQAGLAAMPPTPLMLAPGITFQCNGKAFAPTPSICSSDLFVATLDKDGELTDFDKLDLIELLKL